MENLERIGDHCANIAAGVYYLAEGHPLEETRPKGEETALIEPPSPRPDR